jgi:outer membrane lipoprotein carrier protein
VTRIVLILSLASLSALAADADLKTVLRGVEARYNRAKTLQVLFNESYIGQGRPRQSESGLLTLRKPGRMRWDYSTPPGKLFVSDGKQVYLYNPQLNRAERMPLKASEDMRAPLAFLLGKLDFDKEFRDFRMKPEGAGLRISALAKTDKLPYEKIEMVITPDYEIRQLIVNGQDQSVLTFKFDQEKVNPAVDDVKFKFQLPPGATMVNAMADGGAGK